MNKFKLLMNVLGVAIVAIMPFLGLMAIYVIPMIVAGLMAVVCLMYFIKKPDKRNVKMNLTDVAVLLFVLYGVVQSLFVGGGLQWNFYFKWGALACLYFLFRYFISRKALCYGLVFGGFIQSVVGLLQISGVDIPMADAETEFTIAPQEQIVLDPGRYYICFSIADCIRESADAAAKTVAEVFAYGKKENVVGAEDKVVGNKRKIYFPLYLKGSYVREAAGMPFEKMKVNMGIVVRGVEYR